MPVFVIQSTDLFPDGKRRYFYIEVRHETLAELATDLRGGPIAVEQLFANLTDGEFIVRARRPLMISAASVHHAYPPEHPFVEYEEAANG